MKGILKDLPLSHILKSGMVDIHTPAVGRGGGGVGCGGGIQESSHFCIFFILFAHRYTNLEGRADNHII